MKQAKWQFSRWAYLLLAVMLPYLCLTAVATLLPFSEMQAQRRAEYERAMALSGDRIAQHLGCVTQAVTLLLDSQPLRSALKALDGSTEKIEAGDLYYTVGMPISYRNVLSNRAISAVTIYSGGRLAFYSLQQTTTDLALSRCGAMLYNTRDIPEGGRYFVPAAPNGYVYFVREFTDIYDGRLLGQIVIEVEGVPTYTGTGTQAVSAYDYQVDLSGYAGARYLVYDADGTVLFSDNAQEVGASLGGVLPEELVREQHVAADAPGYAVFTRPLYKPSLTAVMLTPEDSVTAHISEAQRTFLTVALLLGLTLLGFLLYFIARSTAPLRALAHYCRESKEHPAAPIAFDPVFREIGTVQETLGARAAQIEDMQAVIMKNHLQMKDNEIQRLQAQINPHFLFNMLDIIGWQAAKDENPNVSEMVNHLGGLLRNNILLGDQEKIKAGQEVQYIKDYLALEQIRYAGRFTYSIEADEELLDTCYIPKLSIQPIVENCIVHGFEGLTRQGVIEIRIWEDTDGVRCTVYDNGVGFHAEGYFDRAAAEPPDEKRNHIALYNIQERIHMLCGSEYGLQISSIIGRGTEVLLILPLDEQA